MTEQLHPRDTERSGQQVLQQLLHENRQVCGQCNDGVLRGFGNVILMQYMYLTRPQLIHPPVPDGAVQVPQHFGGRGRAGIAIIMHTMMHI